MVLMIAPESWRMFTLRARRSNLEDCVHRDAAPAIDRLDRHSRCPSRRAALARKGTFVRPVLLAPLILVVFVWSSRPAAAQGQGPPPVRSQPARSSSSPSQPLSSATFMGGVPSGSSTGTVVTIGIVDAMNRALEHNLGVLLAEQQIGRATGARWRALSEVLPNVSGRVSDSWQQIN